MDINQIGSTAFIIAAFRAEESDRENPLFKDDYARYFLNDEMVKKSHEMSSILPDTKELVRYRIKYFNDKITEHIDAGATQIVLLGGGFDMRACKYAKPNVQFFDVDQATVLNFKQNVIEKNNINYPSIFIPCNYIEEDVISLMKKGGFKTEESTLFIWEGNSMYIPEKLIFDLFNTLTKNISRFSIAFDYLTYDILNQDSGKEELDEVAEIFDDLGSPWITGFDNIHIIEENTSLIGSEDVPMTILEKSYEPEKPSTEAELINTYSVCTFETE
jgi:methyltransferase (TIGR00027 family)